MMQSLQSIPGHYEIVTGTADGRLLPSQITLAKMPEGEVGRIFDESMVLFNEEMLMNFSRENVKLQMISPASFWKGVSEWNTYGPYGRAEEEPDKTGNAAMRRKSGGTGAVPVSSFRSMVAEKGTYGHASDAESSMAGEDEKETIGRRRTGCAPDHEDLVLGTVKAGLSEFTSERMCRYSFLKQLTDIFCKNTEIDGGHFKERYCVQRQGVSYAGIGTANMLSGYRIWEVFIRKIIMARLAPCESFALRDVLGQIRARENGIQDCEHDPEKSAGELFALIALSRDGLLFCPDWGLMQDRLCRVNIGYRDCLHHLYRKIHGRGLKMFDTEAAVHRISPVFIRGLGDRFSKEREEEYYRKGMLLSPDQ